MLGKLLKYDLKWIYKVVVVFYILAFIFSIIGRGFLSIENSLVFNIVGQICTGVAVGMMISSIINCLMRSWARFVKNIYKDESYLTHTLPVNKKTIYLSKVLSAAITVFTTSIVIITCLAICYYTKSNMEALKSSLEIAASTYDTTVIGLVLVISLILFLELLFVILIGYTGIILGHKSGNNKMVKSIIIAFALYMLTQALTLILIFVFGIFNQNVMNLINTTEMINMDTIKLIMLAGIAIYVVYITIYYIFSKKQFEKGVNVD